MRAIVLGLILLAYAGQVQAFADCPAEEVCSGEEDSFDLLQLKMDVEGKQTSKSSAFVNAHSRQVNKYEDSKHELVMAVPLVVMNLTNFSGLIGDGSQTHLNVSHEFTEDYGSDSELLLDMVKGYFEVLHMHMPAESAQSYCPFGDVSVIRMCLDIGMCLLQDHIGNGNFTMEFYMLLEETVARLDDIGWGLIMSKLAEESGRDLNDADAPPRAYECDSSYDWLYDEMENNETEDPLNLGAEDDATNALAQTAAEAARTPMGNSGPEDDDDDDDEDDDDDDDEDDDDADDAMMTQRE